MTLGGCVAVVTGASGGIGGAVTRRLAAAGARLVLSGRDEERLRRIAEEAEALGVRVRPVSGDLTQEATLEALVREAVAEDGGVDVLIHSLGAYHSGSVADSPPGELDRQLAVNLRVPYALTRSLLPALRSRRGQVVFLNSTAGVAARGGVGAYAAAKHGLRAVADSLRDEVNADGVRVTTIYPGRTATAMQEEVLRREGRPYRPEQLLQPDDVASIVLACLELPATAEVTDVTVRPMRKG